MKGGITVDEKIRSAREGRFKQGKFLPLVLRGEGIRTLVVGGGPVAERKIRALLSGGAHVVLVSPAITPGLAALHQEGMFDWSEAKWNPDRSPVEDFDLVVAATNVREVNAEIADLCAGKRILVNVADSFEESSVIFPSVHRDEEKGIIIAASSGGESPGRARGFIDWVKEAIGGWGG